MSHNEDLREVESFFRAHKIFASASSCVYIPPEGDEAEVEKEEEGTDSTDHHAG